MQTTVLQRLGHVLGWAGNGIAALLLLAGLGVIVFQAWIAWTADPSPGFDIGPFSDGKSYVAIGMGRSPADAQKAVLQFRGEPVVSGPYGDWTVFPIENATDEQLRKLNILTDVVNRRKKASLWREARGVMLISGAFLILPGIVVFFLGRGLKYVFAGTLR